MEPILNSPMTRRKLFQSSAGVIGLSQIVGATGAASRPDESVESPGPAAPELPDLTPARWIWYPSSRCLANTFVLLQRRLELRRPIRRATGWISADSRYLLRVNGRRVQWGPAPCDPRFLEADPVDLTPFLRQGGNVIGAQVVFFGHGDGTCPAGKPGFLFWLEIESEEGTVERVVSDGSWLACLPRAWRPGQYKRSFVRALQEEFDARLYPEGWSEPAFVPDAHWLKAMVLDNPVDKPPITSHFENYLFGFHAEREAAQLRPRRIPLLDERLMPVKGLSESLWLEWNRPPEEYFDVLTPDASTVVGGPAAEEMEPGVWQTVLDGSRAAVLTFDLPEQAVGWPYFTIEAAAGTTVELLVHEAHRVGGPALLGNHWNSWTRFICRQGSNTFETFDYESCRWIQLHIRSAAGPVKVSNVGLRRRILPWPQKPTVRLGEPALQRLMDASINTLNNCALDVCVDGMARERQQYSGECGHQLHAIRLSLGETRLPERFVTTFSQGLTQEGYFLDCWPGYDRMARLMSRPLELAGWGPILDHGIGFVFDCYHHYMHTGQLSALGEVFGRLKKFIAYLQALPRADGLLPVEGLGTPIVWMDHQAYRSQRHKQCAFNLYAAGMLEQAYARLCRAFEDQRAARAAERMANELRQAAVNRFWSASEGLFVDNLPWLGSEEQMRCSDRTLAMSVLFGLCPEGQTAAAVEALASVPPHMRMSYPANACWRLWALAEAGRPDVALNDLRRRWATMESVKWNNTLQEDWHVQPDSWQQWSHCGVVPLYFMHMSVAGVRPLEPGFARCEIRPQLADLTELELVTHTPRGPIHFASTGNRGDRTVALETPASCQTELVVHRAEQLDLLAVEAPARSGSVRYLVPAGRRIELRLRHT